MYVCSYSEFPRSNGHRRGFRPRRTVDLRQMCQASLPSRGKRGSTISHVMGIEALPR